MAEAQPLTPQLVDLFCRTLAETGIVSRGVEAIGVNRGTVYGWRKSDPTFAAAWDAALEVGVTALEDEVKRRAFEGNDKPIFHQGEQIATVREYSDSLAMFVLKGRIPAYRDKQDLTVSGTIGIAEALLAARKRSSPPLAPEDVV